MTFSDIVETPTGLGSATLGDVLSAVLALLLGIIVVKIVSRLLVRLLARGKMDVRVQKYVVKCVRFLLYVITVLIVLECLRVQATSLVALLSVGSLGITLAAEDVLGNIAGGMVILSSHPFALGDFIEVGDTSGTVDEISINHTRLITPDGTIALIPSKTVAASKVTNYTALGHRRVKRVVTASYDATTEAVKDACRAALRSTDRLLAEPESAVYLSDYGASSIEYTVFCWCAPADYWDVYYALGENLRAAFADAGVEMTYDHLNVHMVG